MQSKKIIFVSKIKNPNLYKVLVKKGGTVTFKNSIMTIKHKPNDQKLSKSFLSKIKNILKLKFL